jgi:ZIP family zinc transporter
MMAEPVTSPPAAQPGHSWNAGIIFLIVLPLLLLVGLLALFMVTGAGLVSRSAPPVEDLTIDRITLPAQEQIVVEVTNGGADPVTIAQVQVDDAYWYFSMTPEGSIPRLGRATITIPYPWVQDETHIVKLVSSNGVIFEKDIPVATLTPGLDLDTFWQYALLGLYVGVVPISLGLLWYPFLHRLGRRGMQAILSLTVGLLVFLLFDTLNEALELVGTTPGVFGGAPLVFLIALMAFLSLIAVGAPRKGQTPSRLRVSYFIALGIGLHNLGEGLAIGAAFAFGNATLGTFLVIGFTLHNVTEGVGIAAPIARKRPAFWHFVTLAALAGLPAVVGTWIGGFFYHPLPVTIFFALGAGAIAQVIYEVSRLILRQSAEEQTPLLSPATFGGLAAGILVMYVTALLVAV